MAGRPAERETDGEDMKGGRTGREGFFTVLGSGIVLQLLLCHAPGRFWWSEAPGREDNQRATPAVVATMFFAARPKTGASVTVRRAIRTRDRPRRKPVINAAAAGARGCAGDRSAPPRLRPANSPANGP